MAKLKKRNTTMINDYVLCHLAAVGAEAAEIAEELLEDTVFADEKKYDVAKRREILRERLVGMLGYVAGGYRNLFVGENKSSRRLRPGRRYV